MEEVYLKAMCCDCGQRNLLKINKNNLNKNRIFYPCCNCGLVNLIKDPTIIDMQRSPENWLECIPFLTIVKDKIVQGKYVNERGEIFWVDEKGSSLSRQQFIKEHGYDPWVIYCSSNSADPICSNFPNRCKKMEGRE